MPSNDPKANIEVADGGEDKKNTQSGGGSGASANVLPGDDPDGLRSRAGGGQGGGQGGGGYGGGGGGSTPGLEHIRSYPETGMAPTGDGSFGTPTDMQKEQMANLAAITAKNADTTKRKMDRGLQVLEDSDRNIKSIAADQKTQANLDAANDWQRRQQNIIDVLSTVRGRSGTGWNGSYGLNAMQGLARADDQGDVDAINTYKKNVRQIYDDEAAQLQQNANAKNELLADTEASLDSLLTDFAAQASSLHPGFVSGVYGSEQQNSFDESTPEDERPGFYTYRTQEDMDNEREDDSEDLSKLAQLAVANKAEANYDFAPIIDRENHTVLAPWWYPAINFDEKYAAAVTPRQVENMVRRGNEQELVAKGGSRGDTSSQQRASKASGLAAYMNGYQNRK